MKENVRIVLIGDRRVGKTSLLVSLIKEKFEEEVPPMSAVVTVPQDATPEKVTTHIVDTSLRVQEEQDIAEQILEVYQPLPMKHTCSSAYTLSCRQMSFV
eukprot:TRINITY_DN10492_c0_g1_i2.p5 TRINITY_DN10492_c0_g1~~TRINITY_DN10492_c0_g1_i2.p5  ORF type:complete len:100 (+),score=12.66 TRINITY_DN10492_c0_g1_i2:25-324(+)